MFNSAKELYHSKAWRDLLETIKQERTDASGNIICEYCGKPITKAYDMIGHHTTELTDENVNDYEISLNPAKIQLVHHRCHNDIHHRFGATVRQVFLVYGSPLSGKSTWVDASKEPGDLIIDMDSIWQCISGCPRYTKPKQLKAIAFHIRDTLLDVVRYRQGKWQNAYIIGGYPLSSERERILREMGAREVYIEATKEECLARLAETERDQEAWAGYIETWWEQYHPPSEG